MSLGAGPGPHNQTSGGDGRAPVLQRLTVGRTFTYPGVVTPNPVVGSSSPGDWGTTLRWFSSAQPVSTATFSFGTEVSGRHRTGLSPIPLDSMSLTLFPGDPTGPRVLDGLRSDGTGLYRVTVRWVGPLFDYDSFRRGCLPWTLGRHDPRGTLRPQRDSVAALVTYYPKRVTSTVG